MSDTNAATVDEPTAHDLRSRLVQTLASSGAIWSDEWREAFIRVRRHDFAPPMFGRYEDDHAVYYDRSADPAAWLAAVYTDNALVTHGNAARMAISSSTQPSLMARMLESLDLHAGHRVLEIGTGSGYNAALLSHRVGDERVTTVEIEPDVSAGAGRALVAAGWHPELVVADGLAGWQTNAPYDRVIGTCSTARLPLAWVRQSTPDSVIVANIGYGIVPFHVSAGGSAAGRFLPGIVAFIEARTADSATAVPIDEAVNLVFDPDHNTRTVSIGEGIDNDEFGFWFKLLYPDLTRFSLVPGPEDPPGDAFCVVDPATHSWARATVTEPGTAELAHHGPRDLWNDLAHAHASWDAFDRPSHSRLGLTVTPDGTHTLWTDDANGPQQLTLPPFPHGA